MTNPARILAIALSLTALLFTSAHAENPYGVLKIGAFLPNGKGNNQTTQEGGLKDFDTGFNAEAALGFYLAPYAVIEVGTGYYRSVRSDDIAGINQSYTLGTIPIIATAKFVIDNDPFEFAVGAGAGYYFAAVDWEVANSTGSTHGTALGYHVVGSADYRLSETVSIGSEIKWHSAEPKIDLAIPGAGDRKWEVGGTTLNLTAKYRF